MNGQTMICGHRAEGFVVSKAGNQYRFRAELSYSAHEWSWDGVIDFTDDKQNVVEIKVSSRTFKFANWKNKAVRIARAKLIEVCCG